MLNEKPYGMKVRPFEEAIDINFFYPSPVHMQVLERLNEAAEQDIGPIVLTGPAGTGKSLILSLFAQDRRVLIMDAKLSTQGRLLYDIARELRASIRTPAQPATLPQLLKQRLIGLRCHCAPIIVIVDSAQHLDDIDLEYLHAISQLRHQNKRLLRLVIAGSPQLMELMEAHPTLAPKCRDYVRLHLQPLPKELIRNYVQYHLEVGGAKLRLFEDDVFDEIFEWTGGACRSVNRLCDEALHVALKRTPTVVDRATIRAAAHKVRPQAVKPSQAIRRTSRPASHPVPRERTEELAETTAARRELLEYVRRELNLDQRESAMERLMGQLKDTMSTISQQQRELGQADERLRALEHRVHHACSSIDHQEASIIEAVSSLSMQLEESEQRIAACVATDKDIVSRSAATRQQMLEEYLVLRSRINQHEREMTAALETVRTQSSRIVELTANHDQLVARIDERVNQFESVVAETGTVHAELTDTAEQAQVTLTELFQNLVDRMRQEHRQIQDHIDNQAQRLGHREKECRRAQDALEQAANNAQKRCTDIHAEMGQLGQELERQAKSINQRQEHSARSLKRLLRHAEQIKEQPEQLLQDVQSKVERMRALLESASEVDATLQQTIRQSSQSADSMNDESQRLYRHYIQMQEQASATLGDLVLQNDTAAQHIELLRLRREHGHAASADPVEPVPAPNSP